LHPNIYALKESWSANNYSGMKCAAEKIIELLIDPVK
jgi:hypothetical protein